VTRGRTEATGGAPGRDVTVRPAGAGDEAGSRPAGLLVLAPLGVEAVALRRALPGARVVRTGMGRERSLRAGPEIASLLGRGGVRAVVIAGVGGGVRAGTRPGDLVVASEVRSPDGPAVRVAGETLFAALRRMGRSVHLGPVASEPRPVAGDARSALAAEGVLAADMESAWLVATVREVAPGTPVAVLRAVADTPGRELIRPLATALSGIAALRALARAGPALAEWAAAAGPRRVLLAGPRSFCAGVERAIEIVERALDRYGPPVYVRKQIVHNVHVVRDLERRGAVFVDEIDDVPEGALTVFSAHGISPQVRAGADERRLRVIDATCPLVTKVHAEARRFTRAGYTTVLIGHEGHEEVEGTMGEAPESIRLIGTAEEAERLDLGGDGGRVAYLTQTTLAVDEVQEVVEALRDRFPDLVGPGSDDICYATSNRQEAVKVLAADCDLLLVIGSENSSNSKRLVEVAERVGCRAALIDDESELDAAWLQGVRTVGLTAGASAPESLVERVVDALGALGEVEVVERQVVRESLRFTLPLELRDRELSPPAEPRENGAGGE
jgi:4-hydroxy-3-methylbut-2-en-1-yl diphosphate reductase